MSKGQELTVQGTPAALEKLRQGGGRVHMDHLDRSERSFTLREHRATSFLFATGRKGG